MSNNLYMYFVVRNDLGMKKGKIAAQVGHAAMDAAVNLTRERNSTFFRYCNQPAKIILKADKKQFQMAKRIPLRKWIVVDAGRTQIQSNSETVIAFEPVNPDNVDYFKSFKLM